MHSRALISTALINSTTTGFKAFADGLFAHWSSRLVYAQVWEDAHADVEALQLPPGANIVTISSGGCNALAYLSTDPASVHAVDVNGAHLAVLEIKQQAIKHLADYPAVLAFLGKANLADNIKRYQRHISQHLSSSTRRFWESRSITGKARYRHFSENAYQHGLLGNAIGLAHWLVRLSGGDLGKLAQARSLQEQTALFNDHVAPVFDKLLFRLIASQPIALYSLGIPLSQFAKLKKESRQAGMHHLFKERIRRLACDFAIQENCFAQQAFARRYDTDQQSALPLYLQEQHYGSLRRNINRLYPHHSTLTQFLSTQPKASMDAYVLHDTQDWMDKDQLNALWEQITRTATPGAKVLFRTAASRSPLSNNVRKELLSNWHTDTARNDYLHSIDRAAIYGGMFIYQKNI